MRTFQLLLRSALVTTVAVMFVLVAGCGGGNSSGGPDTGTASLSVTDAPADDVTTVKLTITAVALKPENGAAEMIEFDQPVVIDNLLDLQGSNFAEVLPDREFPAGRYEWVRLYVQGGGNDSYVMTDGGGQEELFVPGQQPGNGKPRFVQLVSGFVIPAGGNVDFTIDIDLRKALTKPVGKNYYLLRPAMRITDNSSTGSISGTVADSLVKDSTCTNDLANDEGNAVYLYTGTGATTGDVYIDENGDPIGTTNPLSVANVKLNATSGEYEYSFGFVPAGAYTIAFTCHALDDMPDTDDDIVFAESADVSVLPQEEKEYDFGDVTTP